MSAVPPPVLDALRLEGETRPLGHGLINATFAVRAPAGEFVVQRVNPIFGARNHENIEAVTRHLEAAGFVTPRLRPTREGKLWAEHEGEVWRAMNRLPGRAYDTVSDPAQALDAVRFVARWHEACADLPHRFIITRHGVHDTPAHLERLREALRSHADHALYEEVAPLAEALLARAEALPELPQSDLPVAHGDLKLNNLLFTEGDPPRAQALIDLDTLAPMPLAHEMGDAYRSWCNRSEEDASAVILDAELAHTLSEAYLEARGLSRDAEARAALLLGPELISLELAARFLADALNESYFGWNAERFATRGHHNLARGLNQWRLHEAFVQSRSTREGK